ncbi:hypothetical protein JCM11641_000750 [Rhodosporidiobolus odoratus]
MPTSPQRPLEPHQPPSSPPHLSHSFPLEALSHSYLNQDQYSPARPFEPRSRPRHHERALKRDRSSNRLGCGKCGRPREELAIHQRGRLAKRARVAAGVVGTLAALDWLPAVAAGPLAARTALPLDPSPPPPTPATPSSVFSASPESHPLTSSTLPAQRTPRVRRRIVPKYTRSDGEWVEDTGWTLRGSTASSPQATAALDDEEQEDSKVDDGEEQEQEHAHDDVRAYSHHSATAMENNLPEPSSSPSATHSVSPDSSSTSPSPTLAKLDSSSDSSTVPIPAGWQPKTRETNFYAVRIIIAMSVLVAVIVVGAIFATVFVRRKNRRRSKRKKRGKAVEEKGWRKVAEKVGIRSSAKEGGTVAREVRGQSEGAGGEGDAGGYGERGEREGDNGGGRSAGSGSGGSRYRRVRTTGFAAGSRVRPRRRRRRDGEAGEDDDEGTALTRTWTGSSASSAAHETLTARLSSRLRSDRARPAERSGPSTVFSRDVDTRAASLTASALSRVTSGSSGRTSRNSLLPPASPASIAPHPPNLLFTPADDPSLQSQPHIPGSPQPSPSLALSSPLYATHSRASSHSTFSLSATPAPSTASPQPPPTSSFGLLISSDALPAPGPPAYRAASSTVQETRRFGAGDSPAPRAASVARPLAIVGRRRRRTTEARQEEEGRREEEREEEEWHWPGEKRRPFPSEAGPSGGMTGEQDDEGVDQGGENGQEPEEEEEPVDRSLFSAHVASDDKAVLARLRARNDRMLVSHSSSDVGPSAPAPSAPLVDDADEDGVDEDGFEKVPRELAGAEGEGGTGIEVPSSMVVPVSPSLLPAPPSRLQYSYLSTPGLSSTSSLSSSFFAQKSTTPSRLPLSPTSVSTSASTSASDVSAAREKSALAHEYAAAGLAEDADEEEHRSHGGSLPMYGATSPALATASAPPVMDSDDEEDEGMVEEEEEEELVEALRRSEEGLGSGRRVERGEHAEI